MSKQITTLVDDIYALFGSGHSPDPGDIDELVKAISYHVTEAFKKREHKGKLRGSIIGTNCDRKLYYDVNSPDDAEPLEPWVLLKFLYGHLIEELALFLAQEAGHKVERRQHEVEVEGIKGHIDAVVDGVLIDVKSASGYGMGKFKDHRLEHDDPFGYLKQIDFYREGMKDAPEISIRGTVGFLAVDKSNGQLVLDMYRRTEQNRKSILQRVKDALALAVSSSVPSRGFSDVPFGKSGNNVLCTECNYCPYKYKCWPGLRKFIYSTGPKWFTVITKEPDVKEEIKEQT